MPTDTGGHGRGGLVGQAPMSMPGSGMEPPDGASGSDLAVHYTLLDSAAAGREEGLRVWDTTPFGKDDGTGEDVRSLKIDSSVVYSLLLLKRLY